MLCYLYSDISFGQERLNLLRPFREAVVSTIEVFLIAYVVGV